VKKTNQLKEKKDPLLKFFLDLFQDDYEKRIISLLHAGSEGDEVIEKLIQISIKNK